MSGFVLRCLSACLALTPVCVSGKTVVFWQGGFPAVESPPPSRESLTSALSGQAPQFVDGAVLQRPETLKDAELLVLPYGSAFPQDAWGVILQYLRGGGNLLVLGGRPFRVPVVSEEGQLRTLRAEDAYERELGILHTYAAPLPPNAPVTFAWAGRYGQRFPKLSVEARRAYVVEGRGINGLGYLIDKLGEKLAAPVVVVQHTRPGDGGMFGSRWVFLDFDASAGYWSKPDGMALLRNAAQYASSGAVSFSLETEFATLRSGESPLVTIHLEDAKPTQAGTVWVRLLKEDKLIAATEAVLSGREFNTTISFKQRLERGFYTLQGTYSRDRKPVEFYENGFWVEDRDLLRAGDGLGVSGDFLTRGGKPFFPFGTNYFSTESNGWDFSGARNAAVWENDFAEMEEHGVSFVRTGVWNDQNKFLNGEGGVPERFLRNLEAYILGAQHHHIAVNFTFFAFDPQTTLRLRGQTSVMSLPGSNPYLDPVTIRAEQNYMLSIVQRFKSVPDLSWDLINEPSFSNPSRLWKGNTPDRDPVETAAWRAWLRQKYREPAKLALAWSVTPDELGSLDSVPLPSDADLAPDLEAGQAGQARAYDYNLFAQETFARWAGTMVAAIRGAGSKQLIDVGQDEGGVMNRVLNQFYGSAGLSFTTNHTYRQNDALLWDSLASKVPGIPNIVGETGYQPIILPNGDWHFDELTGASLIERKWAFGFAGGTSGSMSWDWDREIYFGIKRSDGSDKTWEDTMRDMGAFAKQAEVHATALIRPDVAIILPQSLQLSVFNRVAVEAQQNCVRALYGIARSEAYTVGEDQIASIGSPRLIILPSPWVLNREVWEALMQKMKEGATLLVSGRFDEDPHFVPTDRVAEMGLHYAPGQLSTRTNLLEWPGGKAELRFSGDKTNFLERAYLPDGKSFTELQIGKGKLLFSALPIELNDNLEAIGQLYGYALSRAGVKPVYTTGVKNSGILICPTKFPDSTLYVVSSETSELDSVSFRDERSGKQLAGRLEPGRAALLLVGTGGEILASYNWQP